MKNSERAEKESITLKTNDKRVIQVPAKFIELCPGLSKRKSGLTRAAQGQRDHAALRL